ncbi:hypothetical protein BU26DRAFT_402816, partial [Trematosphaeria pertusa]
DAIPGFSQVAPMTWEYIPSLPLDPLSGKLPLDAPSLIILFSWTGAHGRHIAKYTQIYQTLFPTTRILVITTSSRDFWCRPSARKQALLKPAVERVQEYEDHSSILIHAFSEGGSNKAVEFAEEYSHVTGTRLPCTALALDSTPGHPHYRRLLTAFQKALPPNPFLKATGVVLCGVILGLVYFTYGVFKGFENNLIARTRRRVNDATSWDQRAPRCYLYSRADDLIAWQDVQEHMLAAAQSGVPVMDVCFEKSAHCKHAAEDPARYWNAVVLTWRRALGRKL